MWVSDGDRTNGQTKQYHCLNSPDLYNNFVFEKTQLTFRDLKVIQPLLCRLLQQSVHTQIAQIP